MARICAGPASGCDSRALPLPWCRRLSSLPYSYLQRLAELLVARRCCCHPPVFRLAGRRRQRCPPRRAARCLHNLPTSHRSLLAPIALCCAAPLRPSRAARRRDGCRGGDCVIVCVCVLCVGQRGQCGRRGHAGRPLNQSSAGNVVVQSPPSAGSRRCCIPRARACRAPLEASRRAR